MDVNEIVGLSEDDFNVLKRSESCVVIDGGDYVLKVKEIDVNDPLTCFDAFVVGAFAKEYQQIGMDWELSNATIDGKTFRVEKRQKLELLDSSKISYEEAVIESSVLRRRVEKQLEFPRLFAQICAVGGFEEFNKLVMAREHATDLSDFAIFDGQVVILGESNWFLGLLDLDSKWSTAETQRIVPVEAKYGEFYFAAQKLFRKRSAIGSALQCSLKWWLFSRDVGDLEVFRMRMYDELENMATNNLKVLTTKTPQFLKSKMDFGSVYSEMKKFDLLNPKYEKTGGVINEHEQA